MKETFAALLLWFTLVAATSPVYAQQSEAVYLQARQAFCQVDQDSLAVASVTGLVLRRDVAEFRLDRGRLYLRPPVAGRDCAALFVGQGSFSFTPPTRVEREQLARFFEQESLSREFNFLFLVFADSTLQELQNALSFSRGKLEKAERKALRKALDYSCWEQQALYPPVADRLLGGRQDGYFLAQLAEDIDQPLFFEIDPRRVEEVRLLQRPRTERYASAMETVCQFHRQADYESGRDLALEQKADWRVERYKIDAEITHDLLFSAAAELQVSATAQQPWLHFWLYDGLEVSSVTREDGGAASFYKAPDSPDLWVRLDPPLQAGETAKLTLTYAGELIDRTGDWFILRSSVGWYPVMEYAQEKADFDLTFRHSKKHTLVAVGEPVSSEEQGDQVVGHWRTAHPIRNASFNIGIFKQHQINDPRVPEITVLMNKYGHQELKQYLAQQGILSGKNMEEQVGADVANSIAFFQTVFGESPVKHFLATEIPGGHGEAFPGLIHLSWSTFQNTQAWGADEIFRAHEVAHQWWGIGVDYRTYHDRWLSEGFAEYSGLWYMQAVKKDNALFFDKLKEWRKQIMSNRRGLLSRGQEAGPICLGHRTSSSRTAGDYDLIIYKKGAWVLHMLRNMMIDLRTMNEDRFIAMMRDYYTTYAGNSASTEDFARVVSKHFGEEMGWFFDQWIYHSAIPTYHFSYHTDPVDNGKFRVRCRIRQEGVPGTFRMHLPVKVDFGQNRYALLRVTAAGEVSEFDLPLMPAEPKNLELNIFESVLCEVKKEKWRDH